MWFSLLIVSDRADPFCGLCLFFLAARFSLTACDGFFLAPCILPPVFSSVEQAGVPE